MFDPLTIGNDFPLIVKNRKKLVYLDSAATSQKPKVVLDAITAYYQSANANVHRGVHQLSELSTQMWQEARQTIADFFGAKPEELIITRNTTEAINGAAYGFADHHLKAGDVIMATLMEHHSNLVVWQEVCKRTGAKLEIIPITPDGRLDLSWFKYHLDSAVKLVAVTHVSNALGTLNDINQIGEMAHQVGARVLVDAAQSAPHLPIHFDHMHVDFLAVSAHKMLGPMGIGALIVKQELLDNNLMQPWLFGGGMIESVTPQTASYHPDAAERFTAGTPDVASGVGWQAAIEYLQGLGMKAVGEHDQMLVKYTLEVLSQNPRVKLIGPTVFADKKFDRVGSVAFLYEGVHAHDVAQILDSEGVAVRSGHHCTMPLHTACGWPATIRASFNVYNTKTDVDVLAQSLLKVDQVFGAAK